ncbi:hypothetical protein [Streptomyces sp. NPDC047014]|uniref:hypothetical protein n=1 Tax=Streptomyces sp. NPDC047014 TaxID=3155736 RepID=UPI00340245A2
MGGREHTRRGRRRRSPLRRAVLLSGLGALVVLAGALFLCARPGEPHTGSAEVRATGPAHGAARAVCVSPYDLPGCAPRAHVPPAVLPVPPPPVTLAGGGAPTAAPAGGAGPVRAPAPLARAPDLHVLQVLRT